MLPLSNSARRAADRLARGSAHLGGRLGDRIAARCRKARRDDLDGVAAALGPLLVLLVVGAGALFLFVIVRARPWLMWLLTGVWCLLAWRAGKNRPQEEDEQVPEEPADTTVTTPNMPAVYALLRNAMEDRPGVHLKTVLAHLQEQGQGKGWTVTDLRVRLESHGIPIKKIKAGAKSPTVGVHRDDVPAPSPDEVQESADSSSTAA